MNLTLYKTTSAPNTLQKSLTQIGSTKALTPKASLDILTPDIIITYSQEFLSANMCYIDTFSRYYFCKIEVDTGQRLILHCSVDPLTTYKDYIKNCPICVVRSETMGSNFIIDKQLPVDPARYFIEGRFFPKSPLTYESISPTDRYVLLVNGGGIE